MHGYTCMLKTAAIPFLAIPAWLLKKKGLIAGIGNTAMWMGAPAVAGHVDERLGTDSARHFERGRWLASLGLLSPRFRAATATRMLPEAAAIATGTGMSRFFETDVGRSLVGAAREATGLVPYDTSKALVPGDAATGSPAPVSRASSPRGLKLAPYLGPLSGGTAGYMLSSAFTDDKLIRALGTLSGSYLGMRAGNAVIDSAK